MSRTKMQRSAATTKRLTQLAERAKALDVIFACGGEVQVPAPLALHRPGAKKLQVAERIGFRPTKIDTKLRTWCAPAVFGEGTQTRSDARVREGRQLYARDGALTVEGFDDALATILGQVRNALCPLDAGPPVATLHSLNVYEAGGHFVSHKDTPRDPSVFGTLGVCLPLSFRGGRLVVDHMAMATFDWETLDSRAASTDEAALNLRWAAFFGDVDHRVERVTSGCRATLTYELRRGPATAALVRELGEADVAFTAALVEALSDPKFFAEGGMLGIPCLHLYALPTHERAQAETKGLAEQLKGRDRVVAEALSCAGLEPRVVPYVFETGIGESWRLRRGASAGEKKIFGQKRLETARIEAKLPVEFHAQFDDADDVAWLVRPPWVSRYREVPDGRPEPAVEFLGEPEYSATGYFGNEACDASFYAAVALVCEVPPSSTRVLTNGVVTTPKL